MKRTLVALYDDFNVAKDVAEDLVQAGFNNADIGLIANDVSGEYARSYNLETVNYDDVGAGEGAGFGMVVGALVGLGAMLIPGIGPVIAAGPLASALLGAGVGAVAGAATGGIVAGLVKTGVPEEDAHYYAEGVRRGGTLVTATVEDNFVDTARTIMQRHNPVDLNERSGEWRQHGWSGFDAAAQPYTTDDVSRERTAYSSSSTMSDSRAAGAQSTTGYGMSDTFGDYDADFREHYRSYYSMTPNTYDFYMPAYQFGYTLAYDPMYSGWDWARLEPEARRRWEREYATNPWEDFKDAVQHAWMRVRQAVS
jgi:hypothetical protein